MPSVVVEEDLGASIEDGAVSIVGVEPGICPARASLRIAVGKR